MLCCWRSVECNADAERRRNSGARDTVLQLDAMRSHPACALLTILLILWKHSRALVDSRSGFTCSTASMDSKFSTGDGLGATGQANTGSHAYGLVTLKELKVGYQLQS